jgi:hypothetical protein
MFTTIRSKLAALAVVACVGIVAPQAVAKPVAHSGKTRRIHATQPVSSKASPTLKVDVNAIAAQPVPSTASPTLKVGLNAIYVNGCLSGTIADRTMGGGNNDYDYYGDTCT